jgi:hypothetical protein
MHLGPFVGSRADSDGLRFWIRWSDSKSPAKVALSS